MTCIGPELYLIFFSGNHAFAILCGKECYKDMAKSFSEIFKGINMLIKDKKIDVEGENMSLEFFLGGDYKVPIIAY